MRKPRSEYPSEQSDKFLVRLPDGMRERIAEAAHENKRSMNAEIVARLERSLNGPSIDDPLLTESDLALARQIHDKSQRTLLDISAQAERITSAVEVLLSKATVTPDGATASGSPQKREGE